MEARIEIVHDLLLIFEQWATSEEDPFENLPIRAVADLNERHNPDELIVALVTLCSQFLAEGADVGDTDETQILRRVAHLYQPGMS